MAVGGYRFLAQDLQEWAKRLGQGALLTALPVIVIYMLGQRFMIAGLTAGSVKG
jgi:ABC-type maltose transport system permease subunit